MESSRLQFALILVTIFLDEIFDVDRVKELNINVAELASHVIVGALHYFEEAHLSVLAGDHLSCHVFLLKKSIVANMHRYKYQILRHLHVVVSLNQPLNCVVCSPWMGKLS